MTDDGSRRCEHRCWCRPVAEVVRFLPPSFRHGRSACRDEGLAFPRL